MSRETGSIHVTANRAARKWTRREQVGRVLWSLAWPLFALSPRPFFWGWRRGLLRLFRANVGRQVHVCPSVRITMPWNLVIGAGSAIGEGARIYALGRITIGARVTISQGAHLCAGTHDHRDPQRPLLKPPITIGDDAWIAADAFVGPGVTIGPNAIIGARAVVVRDVECGSVVVGNPARPTEKRTE